MGCRDVERRIGLSYVLSGTCEGGDLLVLLYPEHAQAPALSPLPAGPVGKVRAIWKMNYAPFRMPRWRLRAKPTRWVRSRSMSTSISCESHVELLTFLTFFQDVRVQCLILSSWASICARQENSRNSKVQAKPLWIVIV